MAGQGQRQSFPVIPTRRTITLASPSDGLRNALVGTVYLLAIVLWFLPVWLNPQSRFIGLPTDTQQFMWYLGWFWHAVATHQNPLITYDLNAPTGMNLMWNTSIVAESILFGWLVPLLGLTTVFNVLNAVNLWLMGWFGFRTGQVCGLSRVLAALGGGLCMTLPALTPQLLQHTHVVCLAPWLAATYMLARAFAGYVHRWVLWGAGLGLLAAITFYTSAELVAFTVLAALAFLLWLLVESVAGRRLLTTAMRRIPWRAWASGLVAYVLLCVPGLSVMFLGPLRPQGQFHSAEVFSNDLANFFLPTPIYLLHTAQTSSLAHRYTGNLFEWNGYLGIASSLCWIWAAWRLRRYPAGRALAATGALLALLSLGPHLHIAGRVTHVPLPWQLLEHVPVLHQGLPARLMLIGDLVIVALILWAVHDGERSRTERLHPQTGHPRAHMRWGRLALAAVLLSWLPHLPFPWSSTPAYAADFTPSSTVERTLETQRTLVITDDFPSFMQVQALAGYTFPVVNTYGFPPDPARQRPWLGGNYRSWLAHTSDPQTLARFLRSGVALTGAQCVVYVDSEDTPPPAPLAKAFAQVLGAPTVVGQHTLVWRVHG